MATKTTTTEILVEHLTTTTTTIESKLIPGFDVTSSFIKTALEQIDINSLRLALFQITQDKELECMQVTRMDFRGGAAVDYILSPEDQAAVKEKALTYLSLGPQKLPSLPTKEEGFRLLDLFSDVPMSSPLAPSFSYEEGLEELAFDDFPREVSWSTGSPPGERLKDFKVVLIGAGISGIAAAVYLKRLGIPFELLERQDAIGGTWLLNSYPHVRVDSPFSAFQYKFVKGYKWTEYFPPGASIREYLDFVAAKYGVKEHTTFNRELVGARWNEGASKWELKIKNKVDGTEYEQVCNVVISASGLFSTPNLPDIPGIETFKGPIFHTSHYDHSVDMKNKRIALIGTGSTGTQIAPALAEVASHLTVYQRTANWIVPFAFFKSPISEHTRWMLSHMPYYWNWYCYSSFLKSLNFFSLQKMDREWIENGGGVSKRNDDVRRELTEYVRECLKDRPDLVEKMLPKHAPLVRRMAVDNGFYDTVKSPHVDLVTESIRSFTEKCIVTEDGEEKEVDVVVLGAGFKVAQYFWPVDYLGTEGMTLKKLWEKDGARSYLGLTMPNYPNLFTFYGPNHQPRAGSVHSMGELWSRYTVSSIVELIERGVKSIEVKRDVYDEYNTRLDSHTKELIWESEGKGYYCNEHGRQGVNMPWTNGEYHAMVQKPNFEDYAFK